MRLEMKSATERAESESATGRKPFLRLVGKTAPRAEASDGPEVTGHRGRWPLGRSSLGLFEEDGRMHVVRAARSLFGRLHTSAVSFPLPGTASERRDPSWCETWRETLSARAVKTVTLAVRTGAVAFACRPVTEQDSNGGAPDPSDPETPGAASSVLADELRISVRRRKLLLRGSVRREEVEPFSRILDLDLGRPPACEPAPWAAWRAALHHAPLVPRRGLHLRFLLGAGKGLAVVSHGATPLGWQALSWEGALPAQVLFQSHRLLSVFTERRLAVGPIEHVSVQGLYEVKEGWSALERTLGCPVRREAGPAYDAHLIAFGAALGGLDVRRDSVNLVRHAQKPQSWMRLVPWGEVAFLLGLAAALFLVLEYHAAELRGRVARQKIANAQVLWAEDKSAADIKAERQRLNDYLPPVQDFLSRPVRFGAFVAALPSVTPQSGTLLAAELADEVWKDKPDRKRGRRYGVIEGTTPFGRPEEVEGALESLGATPFFAENLPVAKVVDFASRGEGDSGETRFKILCLPKGGPLGGDSGEAPKGPGKKKDVKPEGGKEKE